MTPREPAPPLETEAVQCLRKPVSFPPSALPASPPILGVISHKDSPLTSYGTRSLETFLPDPE